MDFDGVHDIRRKALQHRSPYFVLDDARNVVPVLDDGSGVPHVVQWALRLTDEMRRVALDMVYPHVEISTVFLGTDFLYWGGLHDVPRLFETAVFLCGTRRMLDAHTATNIIHAERNHAEAVARARAGGYDEEANAMAEAIAHEEDEQR